MAQGLHHRLQDDLSHLLQARLIQQWRWRVGPHAAGVGARIAFTDAFVILCRRQQHEPLAITEGKHRDLRAFEALLQHHPLAGITKAAGKAILNRGEGFFHAAGHRDAFAGCEPIGFDHQGLALLSGDGLALFSAGGNPEASGGNTGLLHQGFGPFLAGFQLRAIGAWAKDSDPSASELIGQARGKRGFWANHRQVDAQGLATLRQGRCITGGMVEHRAPRD